MSSCGYEEVRNSGAMGTPGGRHDRDELPKAPGAGRVEIQGGEERLDLLQTGLAPSPLQRILREVWTCCELGERNG